MFGWGRRNQKPPLSPDQAAERLSLQKIVRVEFYKRDMITADLVCCAVSQTIEGKEETWTFHEEWNGFDNLVRRLATLPSFDADWRRRVISPPFAESRFVAYQGTR